MSREVCDAEKLLETQLNKRASFSWEGWTPNDAPQLIVAITINRWRDEQHGGLQSSKLKKLFQVIITDGYKSYLIPSLATQKLPYLVADLCPSVCTVLTPAP